MKKLTAAFVIFGLAPAPISAQEAALPPGIWTNTEDVYFAEEEGREKAEPLMVSVAEDGSWQEIDAFGVAQDEVSSNPIPRLATRDSGAGWEINGSEIRRAREFSCWVSVRKFAAKPDGSDDWTFKSRIPIHDQGGRALIRGNGEAPDVTIRMRNVTWAKGSRNAPSLVLYVHKDDPVRAESYSWAGPNSARVGINLRWVQGSCSRGNPEAKSKDGLVAAGQEWKDLYAAGDWRALRALYTDDAVLMTHNSPKQDGADNILTFLQRLTKIGGSARFRFEPEEAVVQGDLGLVTAKYWMNIALPGGVKTNVAGRSLLIYKWQDGGWKLWRDMDNFSPDIVADPLDGETP